MARYGEGFGSDYPSDDNRDRWREDDRERSSWRSGGQGTSEREDERGFFQRAGDEIRSWFNEDDDRPDRDYERGSAATRSAWDRDNYSRSGGPSFGSSWDRSGGFSNRDRESSYGRIGRGGSNYMNEDRSEFARRSQGQFGRSTSGWDRDRDRGWDPSRGGGSWASTTNRDRFGSSSRDFGGFRQESDFRSHRRYHPQSWGETSRSENESLGYGEFSGTLGGFGNQTFGSSEHDHYRSWRDRELAKLDRDYDDYCREREHQFNQDFDSWRRNRPNQNPTATSSSPDLGSSSNAGVGTTTASVTGSSGAGSAPGSATTHAGTMQSDASSTETSGSSRSGSRSRS